MPEQGLPSTVMRNGPLKRPRTLPGGFGRGFGISPGRLGVGGFVCCIVSFLSLSMILKPHSERIATERIEFYEITG